MINEKIQLKQHISKRTVKPKYIVIHDTGNTNAYAGAITHKKYFMTTSRKASADFVVDDAKTIQLNDYRNFYTWHCGDGRGKYGITNGNSIGIEMCIDSTGDIGITTNNTLLLVKDLMQELNIPIERIVRHYDASRKICPSHMSGDNWAKWWIFKDNLKRLCKQKPKQSENIVKFKVEDSEFEVEGYLKNDSHYVKARPLLEKLGYKVNWEENTIKLE